MDKPILYSYHKSSASHRVRIALHLKGIDFEYKSVDLLKDGGYQNTLNYKAINPMSQVPTFVDGDNLITQSLAIIQYIDKKWPQTSRLFSMDLYQNTLILEICEIINSGMQPLQSLKVIQMLTDEMGISSEKKDQWCRFFIQKGFQALEKKLRVTAGDCCFGNQVTAADCFLIPQIVASKIYKIDMEAYPTIQKIYKSLKDQGAFKKAHPENQPDYPMEN